ncbi:MAG: hypothetical protein IJB88_00475 [Clostridia bacterium]|nr:hypothetical protein [Clostridia bacterium]
MYSRDMGGIRSDGQLYGVRPEELTAETVRRPPHDEPPLPPPEPREKEKKGLLDLSFLHDLKIEDLLLLAIGFLLLTDNCEENNDLLILLVGLLLLL